MTVSAVVRLIALKTHRNSKKDIDQMAKWARKCGMSFQPVKCKICSLLGSVSKRSMRFNYSLEGVLENMDNIRYLGVTVSKDLKWNSHVSNVCTKANRTHGFLRCNLSLCPKDVKEMAYKGLVRPILEYARHIYG